MGACSRTRREVLGKGKGTFHCDASRDPCSKTQRQQCLPVRNGELSCCQHQYESCFEHAAIQLSELMGGSLLMSLMHTCLHFSAHTHAIEHFKIQVKMKHPSLTLEVTNHADLFAHVLKSLLLRLLPTPKAK